MEGDCEDVSEDAPTTTVVTGFYQWVRQTDWDNNDIHPHRANRLGQT